MAPREGYRTAIITGLTLEAQPAELTMAYEVYRESKNLWSNDAHEVARAFQAGWHARGADNAQLSMHMRDQLASISSVIANATSVAQTLLDELIELHDLRTLTDRLREYAPATVAEVERQIREGEAT